MAEDSKDNVQEPIENHQQPLSFFLLNISLILLYFNALRIDN